MFKFTPRKDEPCIIHRRVGLHMVPHFPRLDQSTYKEALCIFVSFPQTKMHISAIINVNFYSWKENQNATHIINYKSKNLSNGKWHFHIHSFQEF